MSLEKPKINFTSLSSRLTLWFSAASFILVALLLAGFYLAVEQRLALRMDEDLSEDISDFQRILAKDGILGLGAEIKRESEELNSAEESFIRILNNKATPLFSTDLADWPELKTNYSLFQQAIESTEATFNTLELSSRENTTREIYAKISDDYILHSGESLEEQEELMELLLTIACALFVLALPLAIYVGWLIGKKAVKGINAISKTAREIEYGALDKRVDGEMWGDEVLQLAATFNSMLDRIRDLVLEMRELTDNVAHDLRSPLARIRVISESALSHAESHEEFRHAAANIIDECDRLMEMINATLDLAELQAGAAHISKIETDLTALVVDACELFFPLAEEKNIALNIDLNKNNQPSIFIKGDTRSLQRMIANLIDNAIKYTDPDGHIDIDIEAEKQKVKLTIADSGQGIPKEEQTKVFERFYRCDQNRLKNGCGLGLSFAQAVAKAHGGDIQLSSVAGKGSVFSVLLMTL